MYGQNNNTGNPYRQDNAFARIKSGMNSAKNVTSGFDKLKDIINIFTGNGIEESGGTSSFGRS